MMSTPSVFALGGETFVLTGLRSVVDLPAAL